MAKAWVYILRCADSKCYTGHRTDLKLRLAQQQAGEVDGSTEYRLPVELVFAQEMGDRDEAFLLEQRIKGWSRSKKEALIAGDWDLVSWLASRPKFRK